jgi:hypothetical protein
MDRSWKSSGGVFGSGTDFVRHRLEQVRIFFAPIRIPRLDFFPPLFGFSEGPFRIARKTTFPQHVTKYSVYIGNNIISEARQVILFAVIVLDHQAAFNIILQSMQLLRIKIMIQHRENSFAW